MSTRQRAQARRRRIKSQRNERQASLIREDTKPSWPVTIDTFAPSPVATPHQRVFINGLLDKLGAQTAADRVTYETRMPIPQMTEERAKTTLGLPPLPKKVEQGFSPSELVLMNEAGRRVMKDPKDVCP